MTEEAKRLVESLREDAEWARGNEWETPITLGDNLTAAADMIEKLANRRDAWQLRATAAVNDMVKCCAVCKYYAKSMCVNPKGCRNISGTNTGWKWRGSCAENGAALNTDGYSLKGREPG